MGDIGVGDSGGYHQRVYERMETLTRELAEARQRAERLTVAALGVLGFYPTSALPETDTTGFVVAVRKLHEAVNAALAADPPAEAGGEEMTARPR